MMKVLEIFFYLCLFIGVVLALVWFYDKSPMFQDFVDTIFRDFVRNFKEKVGV